MIGSSFCELHAVEDRPSVIAALHQAKTGFQTADLAARCLRKDKTFVTIAWSLQSSTNHPRIFGVGRASAKGVYAFETQR